jgi:hypothetical protein
VSNTAPTLASISPARATAGAGDTALTLAGSGFAPGAAVQFGGVALTPDPATATATSLTVTVPQALLADPRTVAVTVTNTGPGGGISASQTFTVAAPASAPAQASVAPSALVFSEQQIGSASESRQVTMTNGGGSALAVSSVTIVGANPGDFTLTFNTCVGNIPAGGSCFVGVRFAPVAASARAAILSIADSTAGSPQTAVLTGNGTAPPASPAPQATVTASAQGSGTVSPVGTTSYTVGGQATYAASASAGQIFLGWTLDGTSVGYASPLTFTVDANKTLVATFAARPTFNDIPSTAPDYEAITRLAALGIINPRGADGAGNFQPGRAVARAEVAAFIARLYGWDKEFHANPFPDRCDPAQPSICIDDALWNAVAALRDYGVVGGYTDPDTCASAGTSAPCYLPRDEVSRLQVVSIVERAFTKAPEQRPTGSWNRLPAVPGQYANIPDSGTQRSDLATYRQNAGPIPGQADDGQFPDPTGTASRRFIIQVLWQAYAAQFGVDQVP